MCERKQTILCTFEATCPRISPIEVHDWLFHELQVTEDIIIAIQIDGAKKQVFVKFIDQKYVDKILQMTNGVTQYKHNNGEITQVKIDIAGMGSRRIRVANLPLELTNTTIRTSLTPYGTIHTITNEAWSSRHRFQVLNGVRVVHMTLNRHMPSNLTIAGHRAFISYEGQPQTCFECGETDHVYNACPKCKQITTRSNRPQGPAWSTDTTTTPNAGTMISEENTQTPITTTDTSMIIGASENMQHRNKDTTNTLITSDNDMQVEETPHAKIQQNKRREDVTVNKFNWANDEENGAIGPHDEQTSTQYIIINDKEWPSLTNKNTKSHNGSESTTKTSSTSTTRVTSTQNKSPGIKTDSQYTTTTGKEQTKGRKQRLEKDTERTPDPKRTRNRYNTLCRDSS